jgi:hypothetical protein
MAAYVVKNAQILIAGTDLSDHLKNIELTVETANVDATAMGTTALVWQNNMPGVTSWQVTADFNADEASGKTSAILWAVMGLITSVEVRPVYGSRSSTNPAYYGSAMLKTFPILSGGTNDMASQKVTFMCSGQLQRLTA